MADPINILSLFAGSGYHDEAVCAALRVLGFEPRVFGYVEREASAAAWLLGRMEAAALEPAPVYVGDLCELDDGDLESMRGRIDLIVASPPCQPYSSAGKRIGNADERSHGDGDGPLPHTIRIIDLVRPALVQFENVPEWVTGGHFREFGEQLCNLGYDIAPPLFLAAADVGAPHERERVFIQCRLVDAGGRFWKPRAGRIGMRATGEGLGQSGGANGGRDGGTILGSETKSCRSRDGDGYLPERSGIASAAMGNGSSPRHQPARSGESTESGRRECVPSVGCDGIRSELAERPGRGFGVGGQPSERDGQPDGRGEELAESGGPRREGTERGSASTDARAAARRSIAEFSGDVGDAECERSKADDYIGIASGVAARGNRFPMFPPGRNDYRRWAALIAGGLDAACMPAIESKLPALADGLGFSNSELLRLGGNGVVPLCASVAFAVLFGGWE